MKVSIIIPVYNAGQFIEKCIDSVICQTLSEWELIIINDGSTDNSSEKIKLFSDSRIFLYEQKNAGPSSARNAGIRIARGEYLFFLDADDELTSNCLESLYSLAKKDNIDFVYGKYRGYNVEFKKDVLYDRKEIKRTLLDYTKVQFAPHNRLIKRSLVIDNNLFFNEGIKVREDFLWMTFVAKYVTSFAVCRSITYIRGFNENSLTNDIKIDREILGYKVLINTMCKYIDPFEMGAQKALILDALIMVIEHHYYENKHDLKELIDTVYKTNSCIEKVLLFLFLHSPHGFLRTKTLHLLNRKYLNL